MKTMKIAVLAVALIALIGCMDPVDFQGAGDGNTTLPPGMGQIRLTIATPIASTINPTVPTAGQYVIDFTVGATLPSPTRVLATNIGTPTTINLNPDTYTITVYALEDADPDEPIANAFAEWSDSITITTGTQNITAKPTLPDPTTQASTGTFDYAITLTSPLVLASGSELDAERYAPITGTGDDFGNFPIDLELTTNLVDNLTLNSGYYLLWTTLATASDRITIPDILRINDGLTSELRATYTTDAFGSSSGQITIDPEPFKKLIISKGGIELTSAPGAPITATVDANSVFTVGSDDGAVSNINWYYNDATSQSTADTLTISPGTSPFEETTVDRALSVVAEVDGEPASITIWLKIVE